MLAQIESKTQQWDEAARYGMELLAVDRNDELVLRLVADAFLKRTRDPEAAEYLEQIVALHEDDRPTRFRLIEIYRKNDSMNRLPRALDLVNSFLKKNPEDAEGRIYLGEFLRRKPDLRWRAEGFRQGFQTLPPIRVPTWHGPIRATEECCFRTNRKMRFRFKPRRWTSTRKTTTLCTTLAITYLHLRKREDLTATREKLVQMTSPSWPPWTMRSGFRTAPPRKKK
jgi:hypothetical protein